MTPPPAPPDDPSVNLRIGKDEWVATVESRRVKRSGAWGRFLDRWNALPALARIGLFAILLLATPLLTATRPVLALLGISNNDFVVRTGTQFLASAMLAVGLNIVVGYAGLLDLGFVAFYGVAGYAYAYLSSDFITGGVHLPSIISIPIIIAFTAVFGWLLGSLSIRLYGDYLAIVTLGFGQLFVQLTTTLTRVKFFWLDKPVDLTRGPNGINGLDHISLFGFTFSSTLHYYYLLFILLAAVLLLAYRLDQSRLGRAWRAMREDELAAEAMGMPTRRLKLMAFAMGAAIAALAGTVAAAWQGSVTPGRYDLLTLINLYAMIVLGGIGSLPGVVLGAFIFTALPEALRSVQLAGVLFYGGMIVGLVWWLKPSRRLLYFTVGLIGGGIFLRLAVRLLAPGFDAGLPEFHGTILNRLAQAWLVIPAETELLGNVSIGAAVLLLFATLLLIERAKRRGETSRSPGSGGPRKGLPLHWVTLGLTIYLLTFAWETRLAEQPSVTRVLVVGVSLIAMMISRPHGLLGKPRAALG